MILVAEMHIHYSCLLSAKGDFLANIIPRTHLKRTRQIAEVLLHHGLGYLVSTLGLERFVPFHREISRYGRPGGHYTRPERLRLAFEELGPTFIKLGQILSTRADILPPEYIAELARLQDQAPPVEGALIEEIIVAELDYIREGRNAERFAVNCAGDPLSPHSAV